MIGVIPKADQAEVVEEFFELFKTPWEFYRPGRVYDVVIATAEETPEIKARLFLIYGSTTKSIDAPLGIAARGWHQAASVSDRSNTVPVYRGLLMFTEGGRGTTCVKASSQIAGLGFESPDFTVMRLGYDLFDEVQFLLSAGQPIEHASIPTLDIHIRMLREWILQAGIPLLEIPPAPVGHDFATCLTHDIDFVGIRNHKFDHTMWGFLYRATVGTLRNFLRGRLSLKRLFKSWLSAASLPFVYAGWARDFWEPFEWYLTVEKGLPATYFLIPFKRRAGDKVRGRHASRRAAAYDVRDLPQWIAALRAKGCELGVHGIDAWHSTNKAQDELATLAAATGESRIGIRMHWLLRDAHTPSVLELAGYVYDSSLGYNETVGYRAGTSQVFRPLGVQTLLELPLHIQDCALFYPRRLDLSEPDAEKCCQVLADNARMFGGVLTLLWHDRSHGPERFWGDFYIGLLQKLASLGGWFGTAAQVVGWFRKRREVRFEQVEASATARTRLCYEGEEIQPPLRVRIYTPARQQKHDDSLDRAVKFIDIPWNGKSVDKLELDIAVEFSSPLPDAALCSLS
jgi:hypothetical protein